MKTTSAKKYRFHVHNMHCHSCVLLTESEIKEHPEVIHTKAHLKTRSIEICGDFGDMSDEALAQELSKLLSQHLLSTQAEKKVAKWDEFFIAVPIALSFIFLFILLQKLGIVNLINAGEVTYSTAFAIGVIASLSTCMAVVGGLVLSLSATFAHEGDKIKPQVLFHVGRLISFFILGGVIGAVGASFQLGASGTFFLSLIIGLTMLILGINLLDIWHFTKRFQLAMPKFLSSKTLNLVNINHTFTPVLVGILTFFLPCGFTQSMQIYTLSTGKFLTGGLTMFTYALGTLPVLSLLSFSSLSIHNNSKAGVFYKSAGLIVIIFAIYNILNSLVAIGWIRPIFNF